MSTKRKRGRPPKSYVTSEPADYAIPECFDKAKNYHKELSKKYAEALESRLRIAAIQQAKDDLIFKWACGTLGILFLGVILLWGFYG